MSQWFRGTLGGGAPGNVINYGGSTDNAAARFDGSSGKIIQDSRLIIDDNGNTTLSGTYSGNTKFLKVENDVNTASTASKVTVQVGGTTGGDSYNEFVIGANRSYAWGIDNSDTQSFKLTTAAAGSADPSSGSVLIKSTAAGAISFPSASLTQNGVLYAGASGLVSSLGAATNGQLVIGSTGATPVLAALASSNSTISITNGAGSINLATGPTVLTSFVCDSGSAIPNVGVIDLFGTRGWTTVGSGSQITITPPSAASAGTILRADGTNWAATTATYPATTTVSQLLYSSSANTVAGLATVNRAALSTNSTGVPTWLALTDGQIVVGSTAGSPAAATLTAGAGIAITNASNAITVASTTGGMTWTEVTGATQTIAVQNSYITSRGGGVTYTLPATASLGDSFRIVGKTGLATITPNANQQIVYGSTNGTVGATGTLVSTNAGDCIHMVCTTAGASCVFRVVSAVGGWTLT